MSYLKTHRLRKRATWSFQDADYFPGIAMLVDSVVVSPEGIQLNLIERLDVALKEKVSANVNPEGTFALTDIIWLREQDSNPALGGISASLRPARPSA